MPNINCLETSHCGEKGRWEAGEYKPAPYLKRALRDLERELTPIASS